MHGSTAAAGGPTRFLGTSVCPRCALHRSSVTDPEGVQTPCVSAGFLVSPAPILPT